MSDSIAFDRAAGYYDESRGLPPEAEELVADRIEETVGPGARLLELGVGTGRISLPLHRRVTDDDQKVAVLTGMGGVAERLEPVVWKEPETYAQALDWVERRMFASMWRLPDQVWQAAAGRLRVELRAAHPDLDTPHQILHRFGLTAIRF